MKIINDDECAQNIREILIYLKKKPDKEKYIRFITELEQLQILINPDEL